MCAGCKTGYRAPPGAKVHLDTFESGVDEDSKITSRINHVKLASLPSNLLLGRSLRRLGMTNFSTPTCNLPSRALWLRLSLPFQLEWRQCNQCPNENTRRRGRPSLRRTGTCWLPSTLPRSRSGPRVDLSRIIFSSSWSSRRVESTSLARYGGLRCPSEVIRLRWSDINWERGRFKVHSSKTQRSGKGERVVPLFPELREELTDLSALVQPGVETSSSDYVITRYRHTEQNLRSRLHRIADHAGVERWPKPFICLRASRRTELERTGRFANHVLNDWFGHSGAIAETHYLQTTESDFDLAGDLPGDLSGVPSQGRQGSPREAKKQKNPSVSGVVMDPDGSGSLVKYTWVDAFRTSLCSNSQTIADFLRRFADLDLAA